MENLTELKTKLIKAQSAFRTLEAEYKAMEKAADDEFSQVDYESRMAEAQVEEIERRYNLTAKSQAAYRAKLDLVNLCHTIIMVHPITAKRYQHNRAILANLFERWQKHAWAEEQMISLCLRLAI